MKPTDSQWISSPVRCMWCDAEVKVRTVVPFDVAHAKPPCPELSDPAKVEALRVVVLTPFVLVLDPKRKAGAS